MVSFYEWENPWDVGPNLPKYQPFSGGTKAPWVICPPPPPVEKEKMAKNQLFWPILIPPPAAIFDVAKAFDTREGVSDFPIYDKLSAIYAIVKTTLDNRVKQWALRFDKASEH